MFDRFSERARKVISFSRTEALRFNLDYIGTEHILLGLVKEGSGIGANVLMNLDVDLVKVRVRIEKLIKPAPGPAPGGQLPFTPRAKKALEFSIDEARSLGHNYIGTEHLLLGLLREKEGWAAQVLTKLGLTLEDARREVVEFLSHDLQPASESQSPPEPAPPVPQPLVAPFLEKLLARKDLSAAESSKLMAAVIDGHVAPVGIAAIAIALRAKGESVTELAAFAGVMRVHAVKIAAPEDALDVVGTGGDKSGTFNISTATALVAAGLGIPIAKHGGGSVSSKTGSADVLKALGVNIEAPPACVERCIREAGIAFMFAPALHPGMKHAAPVRKELGVRTVFNLLGPLSNPAGVKRSLLGVYDPQLCEKFAEVLQLLGSRSAMVVCGAGPEGAGFLDEMSTFGPTTVARLLNGKITLASVDAQQYGLPVPAKDALCAAGAEDSARIIREVLSGRKGPARDIVVLNAAAAALVAEKAPDWPAGLRAAERSIDEGRAAAALEKLASITNGK